MSKPKIYSIFLPVLLGVILIVLLQSQVIHHLFHIKVLQLPLPIDVVVAFGENFRRILENSIVTFAPAICGLLLGAMIGYAVAVFVTAWPNGGYGVLILVTLINSIPIIALAPLMNRWFTGGFISKLVVITIASTGAMAVNAFRGLNDLSKNQLELMESQAASKLMVFIKLRIPNSLPSIFTGLKIGVSSAMLATIISEFFSSQTSGLGYMIKYTLKVGNQKQVGWAYIVAVSVLSVVFYGVVCLFERHFIRWHVSQRKQ